MQTIPMKEMSFSENLTSESHSTEKRITSSSTKNNIDVNEQKMGEKCNMCLRDCNLELISHFVVWWKFEKSRVKQEKEKKLF